MVGPYAFVVPAAQRDPYGLYEMLDILKFGDVEIHRATAPFSASGKQYPAGSYVIKTAQPYGAFAKTMLSRQDYPGPADLPGGPPEPPYDVTGHTLWMLTGVKVDADRAKPFDAPLELVKTRGAGAGGHRGAPEGRIPVGPESYGVFKMVAELQKANVPIYRAAKAFDRAPGRHLVIPVDRGRAADRRASARKSSASRWPASIAVPAVDGYRLKPGTKVGLWKGAGNMPGGWVMWMLEQYGINHDIVEAAGLRRRPQCEVRRHPAAVGHD